MSTKLESFVRISQFNFVLVSRLNSDTDAISHGLSGQLVEMLHKVIFLTAMLAILFSLQPLMTIVMIVSNLPIFVYFGYCINKNMELVEEIQDIKAVCSVIGEETFSNAKTVKAFATEAIESTRFL